jgi:D-amino-acid dehydrogenase
VLPKILRWLGQEDAPLLFRPRRDWAQWMWGLRFVLECLPGRFERNTRALAGLAQYSRDCLRALREKTGLRYDELSRGILHFATDGHDFEALARAAEAARALGVERQVKSAPECLALEPALRESEDPGDRRSLHAPRRVGRRAAFHRGARAPRRAPRRALPLRQRRSGRSKRPARR